MINYTLYLVTEESVPLEQLLHIVEEAVKGGVSIVQLREKSSSGQDFYQKAKSLNDLLAGYQVPLIINDRVDVALAVGADGVHIGQKDLPLSAVRKIVPSSMIVGVSVSNVDEALEAEKNGADYIGAGAAFPTQSKSDAKLLPKGALEQIAQAVSIPVVAIGGIKISNLSKIADSGIAGAAIVSGIMSADCPQDAAREFLKVWQM